MLPGVILSTENRELRRVTPRFYVIDSIASVCEFNAI